MVNIKGLDKARVLRALYNKARPLGMGYLQFIPGDMEMEKAREIVKNHEQFDYLYGRVMKVDISRDQLDDRLYDRDNGIGAAENAIMEEFTKP